MGDTVYSQLRAGLSWRTTWSLPESKELGQVVSSQKQSDKPVPRHRERLLRHRAAGQSPGLLRPHHFRKDQWTPPCTGEPARCTGTSVLTPDTWLLLTS